ncbi:hypothetical protein Pla108_41970 [Botrimarina colliarenosi]|uniref:Uncharacterized protein n=1 Tax=Botrimarina colliarenosi TaxID=2528001 RepID=A0A5C5ZXR7_9BACT|nr:hypothetical protein [Botrimarina colliarenosi]TWT91787.1 hypothetical protein Pla108_41970 [Botrimarina colliarenosi]
MKLIRLAVIAFIAMLCDSAFCQEQLDELIRRPGYVPTIAVAPDTLKELGHGVFLANNALKKRNTQLSLVYGLRPKLPDNTTPVVLIGPRGLRIAAFSKSTQNAIFLREDLLRKSYDEIYAATAKSLPQIRAANREELARFRDSVRKLRAMPPSQRLDWPEEKIRSAERTAELAEGEAKRLSTDDFSYPRFLAIILLHEVGHLQHQGGGSFGLFAHSEPGSAQHTKPTEQKKLETEADLFAASVLYEAVRSKNLAAEVREELDLAMHPFWVLGNIESIRRRQQGQNILDVKDPGLTHEAQVLRSYRINLFIAKRENPALVPALEQALKEIEELRSKRIKASMKDGNSNRWNSRKDDTS